MAGEIQYSSARKLTVDTELSNVSATYRGTFSNLEYDKLGKMVAEKRNGNGKLKSTYAYNIRDWQKKRQPGRQGNGQGPCYKDAMHFVDGANAAIEYKYNKNGCMTQDLNKNILEIDYYLLNLPTKVTFSDGSVISYSYDADEAIYKSY